MEIQKHLDEEPRKKPAYLWSIFSMKCPRCRRGPMFKHDNPFAKLSLKYIFDMPEKCPVCNQLYDMEQGFWYGTGYVSYAITVAFSVATFVAWLVLFGISFKDNSVLWWLLVNSILMIVLQPWLMRLSRVIYIYFFVKYDSDYKNQPPQKFDA